MSDEDDQGLEQGDASEEESGNGPDTLVHVLSGEEVSATPKNRLVQKTLRQLLESYGFDRKDLRAPYQLTTAGKRQKRVDIAILRHGTDPNDENVERIVICDPQKRREKLRTREEAAPDLRKLEEKMALFPSCHLGMWTNGQEEFAHD
jgi:type I restriction enzyme M protein